MNTKKLKIILFASIFASSLMYADESFTGTVTINGNLKVQDDSSTTTTTEGKARIDTSLVISNTAETQSYATGLYSLAIGSHARATGKGSIAMSVNYLANEYPTFNEYANAYSYYSVAIGDAAVAGIANNDTVPYNLAFGRGAAATGGSGSVAIGSWAWAPGTQSLAIGGFANATTDSAVAIGWNAKATGYAAKAFGTRAEALHTYSLALGYMVSASGYESMVLGHWSHVGEHTQSYSLGGGLANDCHREIVLGQYNAPITSSSSLWNANDPLLVVGNGQFISREQIDGQYVETANRSNAMVIYKSGNTTINGKVTVTVASEGIPMGQFGSQSGN